MGQQWERNLRDYAPQSSMTAFCSARTLGKCRASAAALSPPYCRANAETLWPKQFGFPGVPAKMTGITKPLPVISNTVPLPLAQQVAVGLGDQGAMRPRAIGDGPQKGSLMAVMLLFIFIFQYTGNYKFKKRCGAANDIKNVKHI
jgi:hypothetical protein